MLFLFFRLVTLLGIITLFTEYVTCSFKWKDVFDERPNFLAMTRILSKTIIGLGTSCVSDLAIAMHTSHIYSKLGKPVILIFGYFSLLPFCRYHLMTRRRWKETELELQAVRPRSLRVAMQMIVSSCDFRFFHASPMKNGIVEYQQNLQNSTDINGIRKTLRPS